MEKMMKLEKMFSLQNDLNNYTNGLGWVDGFTENGLEIDWLRCVRMEMVEAIDQSISWKHWKNIKDTKQYEPIGKDGLNNLEIEIVDGWHFLMSEAIKQCWEKETISKILSLENKSIYLKGKNLVNSIDNIQKLCFKYEDDNTFDNFMELIELYTLVSFAFLNINKLYEKYILKNVLNIFRQKNGYKDGSYIKEWGKNKIEDNKFIDKYIENNQEIIFESIYSYLEKEYKTLNS